MPDITDENKNALLLRYASNGAAPLVRAVLQAGANAARADQVCVRDFRGVVREWVNHKLVCVCVCAVHACVQCALYILRCVMRV